jgi:hypothetical protein
VLSEEDYQRNLGEVIQRQFYPDLVDLQTAATLQQRREAGDVAGAVAVRRAARQLRQHDEYVRERELEQDSRRSSLRSEPRALHLETLTGFHARVTSEDNAEFEQAQSEELRQAQVERSRMLLLKSSDEGRSRDDPRSRGSVPDDQASLLLASDAFNAPAESRRPEEKAAAAENSLFFVPQLQCDSGNDRQEESNRLLMPPPASSNRQLAASTSHSISLELSTAPIEYVPMQQLERRIEPANTRFPGPERRPVPPPPPPRAHLEGSDTDGASTAGGDASSASETDLDHDSVGDAPSRLGHLRRQGHKRRARELQTLVPDSPGPADKRRREDGDEEGGEGPAAPASPAAAAAFRLPPASRREAAAERAHEILQERSRKASGGGRGPPSSASSTRSAGGSSSFRATAATATSGGSVVSRSGLGRALRAAYGGGGAGDSIAASSVRGSNSSSRIGGSSLLSRPGSRVVVVRSRSRDARGGGGTLK